MKKKQRARKIFGSSDQPRLAVYKSLKHMYAQIIDDQKGITLVSASTHDIYKLSGEEVKKINNIDTSKKVGLLVAQRAKEKNVNKVVF